MLHKSNLALKKAHLSLRYQRLFVDILTHIGIIWYVDIIRNSVLQINFYWSMALALSYVYKFYVINSHVNPILGHRKVYDYIGKKMSLKVFNRKYEEYVISNGEQFFSLLK